MFDTYFQSSLDPHHRLVLLAAQIAWDRLTESLLCYYSRIGQRAKSIRTVQRYGVASSKKVGSFKRVIKRALVEINKLGKGRTDRIRVNTLKLAGYAREVVKAIPQILEACEEHLQDKAAALGGMTRDEAD